MQFNVTAYIPGDSAIHRADARIKLILLVAYSVTLFLVDTWLGLGMCALLCLAAGFVGRIPAKRTAKLLLPVYVILAFTLLFNSFTFDVAQVADAYGLGNVSAGIFATMDPIALIGSFGLVPAGFARGMFYVIRIVLLVVASFIVTFTTASTDLTNALNDFLRPLQRFKVPTTDIAMVISIAIRFIPVTADELNQVYAAQWVRGASFSTGSLMERLRAWQTVLIPLFVGLFRRASDLSVAMDARCYGYTEKRTELNPRRFTAASAVTLIAGIAVCSALSFL